jgi:putative ABC transport system substrate-binding protein
MPMLLLLSAPALAEAQPRVKPARVGYLGNTPLSSNSFAGGMRELGWIEGRNVVIESRYTEGNVERAPELAAELVRLDPDVIVAASPPLVQAVQRATSSIPVVMFAVADPVGMGFIASLARPGGNITGLTSTVPEGFMGKQLELVKETIPQASRVGLAAAAQALKLQLVPLEIRSADDLERTLTAASLDRLDAVVVVGDPLTFRHRKRIHELAMLHKVPTFVPTPEYLDGPGLLAYGPSLRDASRGAARYVDKILKGAKPADLPVEQPREYRLVVNLRTAKALGMTIPPSVLTRADEIID